MNPDNIGNVADAVKATADAISVPNEVKTALLYPIAKSLGERFSHSINNNQFINKANDIVEDEFLTALKLQSKAFFEQNPNATLDESKQRLIYKQIKDSQYVIDDDEMRQRFAKLISATADKNRNQKITPNMSTVLSNMSPDAAFNLELLSRRPRTSAIIVIPSDKTGVASELIIFEQLDMASGIRSGDSSIRELESMGLITIGEQSAANYDALLSVTNYQGFDMTQADVKKASIWLTGFGRDLMNVIHLSDAEYANAILKRMTNILGPLDPDDPYFS